MVILGRDSVAGIATHYVLDRIPVGFRFSAPVQNGPGAHPASYKMGTGSFQWVNLPGHNVNYPSHLALRIKSE
jgi:hypothetical protein